MINQRPVRPSSSQAINTPASSGKKNGVELRQQLLGYIQDTITAADGTWAYDTNGTDPWDPAQASYTGSLCEGAGPAGSLSFSQTLYGPPIPDPAAKIKEITAHWEKLGYSVRTVAAPKNSPDKDIAIAADLPNGAEIGYTASHIGSVIQAQSECSTDPSLKGETK